MKVWIEKANQLKKEGDQLLKSLDLLKILANYGLVFITGSYHYNLMTWNDIDLCLTVKKIDLGRIFELGREIALLPNISAMYYRNEFVLNTPGNPRAIFWCVEIYLDDHTTWKIDILIGLHDEVERVINLGKKVFEKLTEKKRNQILEIKSQLSKTTNYRGEYRSVDIYRAVLEEGITTLEQWYLWWKCQQKKNLELESKSEDMK